MGPDRRTGKLTHAALDELWATSPDAAPEDGEHFARGCCPACCAPCSALADLLKTGELDTWVLAWPDNLAGTAWWSDMNQVDRAWLRRSWKRAGHLGCHTGDAKATEDVSRVLARLLAETAAE